MKKVILFLISICIVLTVCGCFSQYNKYNYEVTKGDFILYLQTPRVDGKYMVNEQYYCVVGLSEQGKQKSIITIPKQIDGINVKALGRETLTFPTGEITSSNLEIIYLEHFGLSQDGKNNRFNEKELEEYKRHVNDKIKLHREHGTKLIYTFSKYNDGRDLIEHLKEELQKANIKLDTKSNIDIYRRIVKTAEDKYFSKFITLVCNFISKFKVNNFTIAKFDEWKINVKDERTKLFIDICYQCYLAYTKALKDNNAIDFEDMINNAANILDKRIKENDLLIIELSDLPEKDGRITDPDVKHLALHDVGMEEWLGYIEHANCIFTNSFHGCCFSIIFEKLFYVGKRNGDKVTNILNTFNLSTQLLSNYKKINSFAKDVPKKIDFLQVQKILATERSKSQNFILSAIATAEKNLNENREKENMPYENHRKNLVFPINYHSGIGNVASNYDTSSSGTSLKKLSFAKLEYANKNILYKNDESCKFLKNKFTIKTNEFVGWTLRFKIDNRWFWIMENDDLLLEEEIKSGMKKKVFKDESTVPYIPVNNIRIVVAEAKWRDCSKFELLIKRLKNMIKKYL